MPYRSSLPTPAERDEIRTLSLHTAPHQLILGPFRENSPNPGFLQDSAGTDYSLAFRNVAYPTLPAPDLGPYLSRTFSDLARRRTPGWLESLLIIRALSPRAALTLAQEPIILSMEVEPVDENTSRAVILLDKPAPPILLIKRVEDGVEGSILAVTDDEEWGGKTRILYFPRQRGTYRVIVRAGARRYYRDYNGYTPLVPLTPYAADQEARFASVQFLGEPQITFTSDGLLEIRQQLSRPAGLQVRITRGEQQIAFAEHLFPSASHVFHLRLPPGLAPGEQLRVHLEIVNLDA